MQFQSLFSQGFSTKVSKHLNFQSPTKFPKFSNVPPSSSKLSKSSQQFPLCPKHLHFPKLSKVFQHVPKFSNIESFPKLEKFGNLWFSWVFQSFPKRSKVSQSFPKCSKVFQSCPKLPKLVQTCPSMSTAAKCTTIILQAQASSLNLRKVLFTRLQAIQTLQRAGSAASIRASTTVARCALRGTVRVGVRRLLAAET